MAPALKNSFLFKKISFSVSGTLKLSFHFSLEKYEFGILFGQVYNSF